MSRYVARRRAELGLDKIEVMVPQAHAPGAEAEVDFGEFHAVIAGVLLKLWMFVMRLSCSGRAFHVAFATQAQEAFLEGHVLAFEYFGAVPGRVRYDNLKPAVVRVLRGRDRAESERFIALRCHYGFDSFFCIPGKEGAHEKGGVEGEIGRFRRRHLVPVPAVASLAALNQLIAAADIVDDGRVITGRPVTIAAAFADEQLAMGPLPGRAVRPGAAAAGPGGWPGPGVRAAELLLRPGPLRRPPPAGAAVGHRRGGARRAAGGGPARARRRASTPRSWSWTTTWRSCGASPARCPGRPRWPRPGRPATFTAAHQGYWDAARRQHGDAAGTRALIEVLLAHRTLPAAAVDAAMARAIGSGVLDAQAVLIDARRQAGRQVAPVIPIGALARYDRPAPALDAYDQLLTRTIP